LSLVVGFIELTLGFLDPSIGADSRLFNSADPDRAMFRRAPYLSR
jgi:hypothetical protein